MRCSTAFKQLANHMSGNTVVPNVNLLVLGVPHCSLSPERAYATPVGVGRPTLILGSLILGGFLVDLGADT
jgi:hypothetical protein